MKKTTLLIGAFGLFALMFMVVPAWADPNPELLWPEGAPGAKGTAPKDCPTLTSWPVLGDNNTDTAIVICPGGGYGGLAADHEGRQLAQWFNSLGINAFVLEYRHKGRGYHHPAPLQDAQRAVRTVRANAAALGIDPKKIGAIGFSAGGHLVSSLGTHFDSGDAKATDPIEQVSCRPDFLILCYPVIAWNKPYTHRGSQRNLLGENADPKLVEFMSSEKQVSPETPPTFLWTTNGDKGVPCENSIAFFLALRKAGVPCEIHIYQNGCHGLGLVQGKRNVPGTDSWPRQCENWLKNNGLLSIKK
jgi:acetyl esterase/lipase